MDGLDRNVATNLLQTRTHLSAQFRAPTNVHGENANENPDSQNSLVNIPNFTLPPGGFPITDGDVVFGSIGVGGGSGEEVMDVAQAALAALAG